MAGDGLKKPINAPKGQSTPVGVQPGVSQAILLAHFLIVSGGGGVFVYAGVPGPGNPPIEWLGFGLTDPFGNALPQQVGASNFYLAGVLEWVSTTTPSSAPSNGITAYVDSEDNLDYINGNDRNTYRTGRIVKFGDSGQLISSTSPTAITGMSLPVAVASYHIQGWVNFTGTGAVGGAVFNFGGATLSHADGRAFFLTPGVGLLPGVSLYSGALAASGSGTMTGALQRWEFDVWVTSSGGGTNVFTVTAQEGNAGDSFTVNSAYMRAETFN